MPTFPHGGEIEKALARHFVDAIGQLDIYHDEYIRTPAGWRFSIQKARGQPANRRALSAAACTGAPYRREQRTSDGLR